MNNTKHFIKENLTKAWVIIWAFLESRMSLQGRKYFIIAGILTATYAYAVDEAVTNVTDLALLNTIDVLGNVNKAGFSDIFNVIAYNIGFFAMYCAIACGIFIMGGEIFIRFCDYFKIKSKLYDKTKNLKDITTMGDLEYIEKHMRNEEKNKK